ncbi:carbohydrate ABC transporter permease [Streptomyces luteireticuli]|uniref:carbohydrate ABC transporter permease n=1 Tax=Streptomyces luteireticuli TaxID=173858 RepID=UPI0035561939
MRIRELPVVARHTGPHRHQAAVALLFLLPALLFYAVFIVLPVLFTGVLALSTGPRPGLTGMTFAGPDNFTALFAPDSSFLFPVLTNTLLYAAGTVVLTTGGGLVAALCLVRLPGQGLWRTLYFLPVVTTVVATGNAWKHLYRPDGPVNAALNAVGLDSVGFLQNPSAALPAVVVVQSWASLGSAVLILTAGLTTVPRDCLEAAALDGAGPLTVLVRVTLPLLRPALLFVCVTQLLAGLQSFALIAVMTGNGGPGDATDVAALEMYRRAFTYGDWGTAGAAAFVLFLVTLVITLAQLRLFEPGGGDA